MKPFTHLEGFAAPIDEDNIDTDVIFPARYLLLLDLAGLGTHAFHDRRYCADGSESAEFVLNREPFRRASVLVAGENFGCGSSREQAVWCLADFGIRCVIAASFGDIFAANCINNGVLPIKLDHATIARLIAAAQTGEKFAIDLVAQTLTTSTTGPIAFSIAAELRDALLQGRDAISTILTTQGEAFAAFEMRHGTSQPWLSAPTGD